MISPTRIVNEPGKLGIWLLKVISSWLGNLSLATPKYIEKSETWKLLLNNLLFFEHPRKEICSVVLVDLKKFSCFGRSQKTLAMNYDFSNPQSHMRTIGADSLHSNMCPCPKSPSFVGVHIPAPWFANMGVPPGFPLAILKRAYPKNHPVVMDDHDGSYWNNKKVTTWDPPF